MSTPQDLWHQVQVNFSQLQQYTMTSPRSFTEKNQLIDLIYQALQQFDPNELPVREYKLALAEQILADMQEHAKSGVAKQEDLLNKEQLVTILLQQARLLDLEPYSYYISTANQAVQAVLANQGTTPHRLDSVLSRITTPRLGSFAMRRRSSTPPPTSDFGQEQIPPATGLVLPPTNQREPQSSRNPHYELPLPSSDGFIPPAPLLPELPPHLKEYKQEQENELPHITWAKTTVYPADQKPFHEDIHDLKIYEDYKAQKAKPKILPGSTEHKKWLKAQLDSRVLQDNPRELSYEEKLEFINWLKESMVNWPEQLKITDAQIKEMLKDSKTPRP